MTAAAIAIDRGVTINDVLLKSLKPDSTTSLRLLRPVSPSIVRPETIIRLCKTVPRPILEMAASTASILIRFAQSDAPSLVIAVYRLSIAFLILTPVLLSRYRSDLQAMTKREVSLTLISGMFLAIHFATWITSLEYTSVASSVVLVQTAPLFVALLSPLILRERLSHSIVAGLILALIGSLIIGLSDACSLDKGLRCPSLASFFLGNAMKGDLLALAGAAAGAGYIIIGRRVRSTVSLIPYITLTYGVASVVLIVLMLRAGHPPFGYSPQTYLWLLLLALLPHGIIELPMVFLAAGIGLRLGHQVLTALTGKPTEIKREFKDGIRFYFRWIMPLLFVAAVIETFITPLLLGIS